MEIRLPERLETKLNRLASEQGRDAAGLVVEAIERMVDYDGWFLAEVKKGLAQIENGETLTHEEAGARLEKYMSAKYQVA